MKDKKILVTGGAGFIGSELVRQLVAGGAFVKVVDNLVNGRRENLEALPQNQIQFSKSDIRDGKQMEKVLQGVDIIYHLACLGVRHSIHSPRENHDVNATATLDLLSVSRKADVERFICVSSSEVYGTAKWVPMTEEYPPSPMTVYGASKLAGECYARAYFETYKFPTVVVRPFNAYGPHCHHEGDSGEVIPKFLLRSLAGKPMIIHGDGEQTRDFTYVSDTARGILLAGTSDDAIGKTINLGSGKEIKINHLASEIAAILNEKEPQIDYVSPRPGDVLRLCADTQLASKLLNFKTEISLKEGLVKLKEWYIGLSKSPAELLADEWSQNWELPKVN